MDASEANVTTNTKYKTTAGSWKTGNEVVSGGLILGDERTSAYNTPVVATLKDNKFTVAKGDKMSIHSDGTVATTVTMDALTAVEAYGYDHDEDETTVVTENNVVKSNIAEVVAKSEKDDTKLYYVTGVVKDIYDETHGNIHLLDKTTGQSMIVYGTYLTNEYSFDGSKFSFKQSDSTPITKEYIGKEITVAGTLGFHGGAGQIVNGFVLDAKADKYNDDLTVSYDNSKGTVVLSKENPQLGDEVTITATPKEGYRLSKVTLKTIDDVESDITSTLKFTAGLKDTITVEFVSDSTPVATVHEVVFNGENNNEPVGAYDKTWTNTTNGIKYVIVNGNNNTNKWDYIKFGRKKVASIGNIHTLSPFANPIASSTITIDSITAAKVNSIKFYISTNEDFSNAEVHNLAIKTGVIETTVTTPVANAYYKYEFDCQSGSGNGFVQISKVTFTEKV